MQRNEAEQQEADSLVSYQEFPGERPIRKPGHLPPDQPHDGYRPGGNADRPMQLQKGRVPGS